MAAEVPDQPHPLNPEEFADLKDEWDFLGGWQPHRDLVARLVARVEAQATQLADAHAVIRRYASGWRAGQRMAVVMAGSPRPPSERIWMHDDMAIDSEPMSLGEAAAIAAARIMASPSGTPAGTHPQEET